MDLDGRIISLLPSFKPLQTNLSGLLRTPLLVSFSSTRMTSFPVSLALTKWFKLNSCFLFLHQILGLRVWDSGDLQ
jgi:hypothetical protein